MPEREANSWIDVWTAGSPVLRSSEEQLIDGWGAAPGSSCSIRAESEQPQALTWRLACQTLSAPADYSLRRRNRSSKSLLKMELSAAGAEAVFTAAAAGSLGSLFWRKLCVHPSAEGQKRQQAAGGSSPSAVSSADLLQKRRNGGKLRRIKSTITADCPPHPHRLSELQHTKSGLSGN